MNYSQKIKEMTLSDNFMFCSVMENEPELARELIEMILDKPIERVEIVHKEKVLDVSFSSKSVRMDVYLSNGKAIYNLEMQTTTEKDLPKRMRYYQSITDVDNLLKGEHYLLLKPSYIIFLCTFDYFKRNQQKYSFTNKYVDKKGDIIELEDETYKIIINGACKDHNSKLDKFLRFIESNDPEDEYTRRLLDRMNLIKQDDVWRQRYMEIWDFMEENKQDVLNKGIEIGKAQGFISAYLEMLSKEETIQKLMSCLSITESDAIQLIENYIRNK